MDVKYAAAVAVPVVEAAVRKRHTPPASPTIHNSRYSLTHNLEALNPF